MIRVRILVPVQTQKNYNQSFLPVYKAKKMNKVSTYFKDSYKELLEKVTWPTWAQLQQSTMIVLVATLVITAIVWTMDFASSGILQFIYKQF